MRISSIVLLFGMLFGSILLLLSFPTYLGEYFYIILVILVILFAFKLTFDAFR